MTEQRFGSPIFVNHSYQILLRDLWHDAHRWFVAANGQRAAYNNPIGQLLAKDLARKSLDRYFSAIDALIPNDKPKEKA